MITNSPHIQNLDWKASILAAETIMRTRLHHTLALTALFVLTLGCHPKTGPAPPEVDPRPHLRELVRAVVEDTANIHGAALAIDAPALELYWEGSAGLADPEAGIPMTLDTPVRIASNTKTFIAVAILRLMEDGRLGLDDAIADHIPGQLTDILREDGYEPEVMTIRHLLTHSSGLFDHSSSPLYADRVTAEPMHRWSPTEQIEAATKPQREGM